MKAIFISYNQALTDRVNRILDELGVRGFTRWALTEGRGTFDGEPHYGSHAWPSLAQAIMTVVEDSRLQALLAQLKALDNERPKLGLRAFVLPVDQAI